jgi:hypothetical protein
VSTPPVNTIHPSPRLSPQTNPIEPVPYSDPTRHFLHFTLIFHFTCLRHFGTYLPTLCFTRTPDIRTTDPSLLFTSRELCSSSVEPTAREGSSTGPFLGHLCRPCVIHLIYFNPTSSLFPVFLPAVRHAPARSPRHATRHARFRAEFHVTRRVPNPLRRSPFISAPRAAPFRADRSRASARSSAQTSFAPLLCVWYNGNASPRLPSMPAHRCSIAPISCEDKQRWTSRIV